MKKNTQMEKILKPYTDEVKRHMSALSEDFQGRVKVVSELVISQGKKIDTLTETVGEMKVDITSIKTTLTQHTEQIEKITEDVGIIKTNVEFMKDSLKKKVDYDEFIALEKRVSVAESKVKR